MVVRFQFLFTLTPKNLEGTLALWLDPSVEGKVKEMIGWIFD